MYHRIDLPQRQAFIYQPDQCIYGNRHQIRQPCADPCEGHRKYECHDSDKTRQCGIFSGQYPVDLHAALVLLTLMRTDNRLCTQFLNKVKTHVGERRFTLHAAFFFHV